MICPRCGDVMRCHLPNDYPQCLTCGYEDYGARMASTSRKADVRDRIRYGGPEKWLRERLVFLRLLPTRETGLRREVIEATCPFCDQPMSQDRKRHSFRKAPEQTYTCELDHRIRVSFARLPSGDVVQVWE